MTRRFVSVPAGLVRIPDDALRSVDEVWVATLAAMMAAAGQVQPIDIAAEGDGYRLVFGLHRLLAARHNGADIDAMLDDAPGTPEQQRERAIHENLGRSLSKLDRAVHIAEFLALRAPGRRRGGDRRSASAESNRQVGGLIDVPEEIAERVGLSQRSVERAVAIANGIGAALRRRIVADAELRWLTDSQGELERLAAEPENRQTRLLDLIAKGEAGTIADAIGLLDGARPENDAEKWRRRTHTGFARLAVREQFAFLDEIETTVRTWARKRRWTP